MGVSGMTEEPKKRAEVLEAVSVIPSKGRGFFREHPTFFLTLMYVDLTGIGIFYAFIFYRQFGINIFDFAEIGDFLIAAFKAPAVTFSVLLVQVLLVSLPVLPLIVWFRLVTPRFRAARREREMGLPTPWIHRGVSLATFIGSTIMAAVVISVTGILPHQLARSQADAIKQGEQPQVTVQYRKFSSPSTGQVTETGVELIGATQKVVFFYDVTEKDNEKDSRTLIIPQAQIVSIEVQEDW